MLFKKPFFMLAKDQALVWACNKKKIQNIYAAVSKIFSDQDTQ